MALRIRPYRAADRDAVYDVCVRTGASGEDARGLHSSDDLLPDAYAGPYLELEPELAFVLDDGERAVGYVLGTADTGRFVRRWRAEWLPRVAAKHPEPAAGQEVSSDDHAIRLLHHPERMLRPELAPYPAHLHVDLLPSAQGGGHGRALLETFFDAAARAGAPAVHLGVAVDNVRARGFYARLGFEPIPVAGVGGAVFLGRSTAR